MADHVPVAYSKDDDGATVQFWLHTSIFKALKELLPPDDDKPEHHFVRQAFVHAKRELRNRAVYHRLLIIAKAPDAKAALMVLWHMLRRVINNDQLGEMKTPRTTGLVRTAEYSYKLVNTLLDELELGVFAASGRERRRL